jgi:hypothetical protein
MSYSLGEKNWDHMEVENRFLLELQSLQHGYQMLYHGGYKKVVLVRLLYRTNLSDGKDFVLVWA